MELRAEIIRRWPRSEYTIGDFYIGGKNVFNSLERPLTGDGPVAIPPGEYEVDMTIVSPKYKERSWSKKWGGIVPTIKDVPGHDRILIHPGNTAADTTGCVCPGYNRVKGKVVESVKCYDELMTAFTKAHNEGKKIILSVIQL